MNATSTNLDGYGAPPIAWQRVRETLAAASTQIPGSGGPARHTPWLTSTNLDGTAHVRPVGIVSIDGVWYFNSGPGSRKSRNIAADPRCVLSIATHDFDLVLEGSAQRVVDSDELRSVATAFNDQDWPCVVDGDGLTAEFSAPSAGPPPWHVYRMTPDVVYAFGTAAPYGATKFEIDR
ncbi:pyridoxamine 5'-phosphate oxidase family protein [Mycobacterium deserti]|uniref:Pyridoxamine 5'-phosphate oxidase family protein n=1 Tax=Mycobacterium deserti TaxID=2978347 RepID=A0ABT2M3Z3_9MYCO|nr:pyridoxamine 5'-phosphate oxidase family protein [Mycobacterium deserti]MCT7656982.1 pyridoxamine 5'-phosphate oxidase family protein [Mycobacterium deserti]